MASAQEQVANVVAALLERLDIMNRTLNAIKANTEQEADWDVTYVVGGALAATIAIPFQIPKTMEHVEIELSGAGDSAATCKTAAVLLGNPGTAQASQIHGALGGGGNSGAEVAIPSSGSGKVKVRTYTDQSGYMTVLFVVTGATTAYVNVRIRNLDRSQARSKRT